LTELLLEIDARTGFTREFTHVSESGARDLHVSLRMSVNPGPGRRICTSACARS
jgi:hypothetical protein